MKRRESDRDLRGGGRAVVRKDRDKVFRRSILSSRRRRGDEGERGEGAGARASGGESWERSTKRTGEAPGLEAPAPQGDGPARRRRLAGHGRDHVSPDRAPQDVRCGVHVI